MTIVAVLNNDRVVINKTVIDGPAPPNTVDITDWEGRCEIGDTWDGKTFTPPPPPARPVISRQEFIDRWEFEELAALKMLAAKNTQDGVEAAVFWDQVMARDTINLQSPLSQAAKLALQGWGIMTNARADEVFR